jgi:hypothetical protein
MCCYEQYNRSANIVENMFELMIDLHLFFFFFEFCLFKKWIFVDFGGPKMSTFELPFGGLLILSKKKKLTLILSHENLITY